GADPGRRPRPGAPGERDCRGLSPRRGAGGSGTIGRPGPDRRGRPAPGRPPRNPPARARGTPSSDAKPGGLDMIAIVGGGLSSAKVVEAYREAGGEDELVLFSADSHPPYHRPPLSQRLLRGEAEPPDALLPPRAQ